MARLHLPKAYITIIVKDKNGKTIYRKRMASKSWVGNIMGLISALLSGVTTGTSTVGLYYGITRTDLVDTAGTARGLLLCSPSSSYRLGAAAPEGDTSFGIVVGTSDVPVSISQYNLLSPIPHGTGPGQLYYYTTMITSLSKDNIWSLQISRTFGNLSGTDITVREVGLIILLTRAVSAHSAFLLARDVIPGGVIVPSGASLTVTYTIQYSL